MYLTLLLSKIKKQQGTSLAVQWLALSTFTAKSLGSVPGQGAQVTHADSCGYKRREEEGLAATVPLPGERRLGG